MDKSRGSMIQYFIEKGVGDMAIDVTIRASLFSRKPLPLDVIIGADLHYGNAEDYVQTMDGEVGQHEFIAYLPDHIGRGFQVIWHEGERKRVVLRQPLPCCREEMIEFYHTVERIVTFWKGSLNVDGKATSLKAFLGTLDENQRFNENTIRDLGMDILNGFEGQYEIYGAMWPLRPGHPEGRLFLLSPESYGKWLHEKQEIDACYWPVVYGVMPDEMVGIAISRFCPYDVPAIYPDKVSADFTTRDPQTGRSVPVTQWILTVDDGEDKFCEISYDEFRSKLPAEKVSRYDSHKILIQPMTGEELRAIYAPKEQ